MNILKSWGLEWVYLIDCECMWQSWVLSPAVFSLLAFPVVPLNRAKNSVQGSVTRCGPKDHPFHPAKYRWMNYLSRPFANFIICLFSSHTRQCLGTLSCMVSELVAPFSAWNCGWESYSTILKTGFYMQSMCAQPFSHLLGPPTVLTWGHDYCLLVLYSLKTFQVIYILCRWFHF